MSAQRMKERKTQMSKGVSPKTRHYCDIVNFNDSDTFT